MSKKHINQKSEVEEIKEDALEIGPKKEVNSKYKSELSFDFPPDVALDSNKMPEKNQPSTPEKNESEF